MGAYDTPMLVRSPSTALHGLLTSIDSSGGGGAALYVVSCGGACAYRGWQDVECSRASGHGIRERSHSSDEQLLAPADWPGQIFDKH